MRRELKKLQRLLEHSKTPYTLTWLPFEQYITIKHRGNTYKAFDCKYNLHLIHVSGYRRDTRENGRGTIKAPFSRDMTAKMFFDSEIDVPKKGRTTWQIM